MTAPLQPGLLDGGDIADSSPYICAHLAVFPSWHFAVSDELWLWHADHSQLQTLLGPLSSRSSTWAGGSSGVGILTAPSLLLHLSPYAFHWAHCQQVWEEEHSL